MSKCLTSCSSSRSSSSAAATASLSNSLHSADSTGYKKSFRDEEERRSEESGELFLERKFAEEFLRNQKILERDSTDARLRYNNEKLEYLEHKLNEIIETRLSDYNEMASAINYLISCSLNSSSGKNADGGESSAENNHAGQSKHNVPLMNKRASMKKSKQ